jgi:ABC-type polysaccharide/polyol phosphate export permease
LPLAESLWQAWSHRSIVYAMALPDFESRYVGTLGGPIWALIQPLSKITIVYLVFAIGFRV